LLLVRRVAKASAHCRMISALFFERASKAGGHEKCPEHHTGTGMITKLGVAGRVER
jgi:hypothetical protein